MLYTECYVRNVINGTLYTFHYTWNIIYGTNGFLKLFLVEPQTYNCQN